MPPPSSEDFAATLKKARLAAGLSQAELGDRAGLTGSYVCMLELRRKPAPSPDVVDALAKALVTDANRLQEVAALERTPEPVRQRVLRLLRERTRIRRTRDRLLTTTLFHMTRRSALFPDLVADALGLPEDRRLLLGRIAKKVKEVPSLAEAEAQSGDLLREVPSRERDALVRELPRLLTGGAQAERAPMAIPGAADAERPEERPWRRVAVLRTPPAAGDPFGARDLVDSMHLDRRLWAEGAFVLVADDDDAYPRIESGDWLLVHPTTSPAEGALVVVRDGARARIRVFHRQADGVRLDSPRSDVPPLRGSLARYPVVGRVAWVFRPLDGPPAPRRRAPDELDTPGAG